MEVSRRTRCVSNTETWCLCMGRGGEESPINGNGPESSATVLYFFRSGSSLGKVPSPVSPLSVGGEEFRRLGIGSPSPTFGPRGPTLDPRLVPRSELHRSPSYSNYSPSESVLLGPQGPSLRLSPYLPARRRVRQCRSRLPEIGSVTSNLVRQVWIPVTVV